MPSSLAKGGPRTHKHVKSQGEGKPGANNARHPKICKGDNRESRKNGGIRPWRVSEKSFKNGEGREGVPQKLTP